MKEGISTFSKSLRL